MRIIFFLLISFYVPLSFCMEIPFEQASAKSYYEKSDMVFLGLKLSEPMSFESFSGSLEKLSIFNEGDIVNLWEVQSKEDRYLVIKVYKGDIEGEGRVLSMIGVDSLNFPKIGSLYFLFADKNNFVDWCGAFSLDAIPEEKLDSIVKANVHDLIDFLVANKLHYCLNPPRLRLE